MKNKHVYAILLSIFCVVTLLVSVIANKVSANTLIDNTTKSLDTVTVPVVNTVLQKPVLTVSVQTAQIVMKISAPGATVVTINCKNDKGETTIYKPILTPEGTWFFSVPIPGLALGTYTSYATADSGTSIFGQSNIVSYEVKAPEKSTVAPTGGVAAPNSGISTSTTSPTSVVKQSEVTIKDISGVVGGAVGATVDNLSKTTTDSAASSKTTQVASEATTLPEQFVKNIDQIKSTKTVDAGGADSPVIQDIKNTKIAAVDQGSTNKTQKDAIIFSGKAKPNSTIYLYIFSDPIIVSVKADENGNWQYILDRPLDTGKHESYVLIEDSSTKEVLRTEAKSFFISGARATSSMMDIPGNKGIILEDPFMAMVKDYSVYVGVVIGLAILVVLLFGLRKYRKAEANESDFVAKNE